MQSPPLYSRSISPTNNFRALFFSGWQTNPARTARFSLQSRAKVSLAQLLRHSSNNSSSSRERGTTAMQQQYYCCTRERESRAKRGANAHLIGDNSSKYRKSEIWSYQATAPKTVSKYEYPCLVYILSRLLLIEHFIIFFKIYIYIF